MGKPHRFEFVETCMVKADATDQYVREAPVAREPGAGLGVIPGEFSFFDRDQALVRVTRQLEHRLVVGLPLCQQNALRHVLEQSAREGLALVSRSDLRGQRFCKDSPL